MTNFDVVSTFIQTFLNAINFGYTAIQPSVNFIMAGLITILITITAGLTWLFGDWEGMIKGLIGKILVIGFILLLVQHWESYTNDVDVGLTQLGLKAGGLNETANTFLQSPQTLATQGFLLCRQICAQADAVPGGVTGLNNLPDKFIYGLAAIGIFLSYLVMAIQIFVAYIEFKIINLAALIFVPFAIWQKTEFLSQRTIGYMFSAGTKLFVLALVIGIGMSITLHFTVATAPSLQNALAILMGSVMLMALSISAPHLAQALISGGPQLNASNAATGAAAIAGTIGGAGVMGARALGSAGQAGGAMIEHGNRRNAEGFEQMRRAATAGDGGNANATTLSKMAKAAATDGGGGNKTPSPPPGGAA